MSDLDQFHDTIVRTLVAAGYQPDQAPLVAGVLQPILDPMYEENQRLRLAYEALEEFRQQSIGEGHLTDWMRTLAKMDAALNTARGDV